MISNIDKINNKELRENIRQIRSDVFELFQIEERNGTTEKQIISKINSLLYQYVLGVGKPISICDSGVYLMDGNGYEVSLLVNYQITYGYKPYQDLDKPIQLDFTVTKSEIRNNKIEKIFN